jgi:hypothetical protein
METPASPIPDRTEQAAFLEDVSRQYLAYTLDCFDRIKAEGQVVLQWHFGVITGGLVLTGTLHAAQHECLAAGFLACVAVSSLTAIKLIAVLKSRDTAPPGNLAGSYSELMHLPAAELRLEEAKLMDKRSLTNREAVDTMADGVDSARQRLSTLPAWFFSGLFLGCAALQIYKAALTIC